MMNMPTVRSMVRVNADDVERDVIGTDCEMNEVRLRKQESEGIFNNDSADSWVVDTVLDGIEEHSDIPTFSSQEGAFISFQDWFQENLSLGVSRHTCLLVGGRSSGKSFSMLGDDTSVDQGLVPRFVKSLFSTGSQCAVNMSVYMAYDSHFADLLSPPHTFPYAQNTIYSPTMGTSLIPGIDASPIPTPSLTS
jgi:hypothetical protein